MVRGRSRSAASPWPHTRWHSIRRRVRAVCHRSLAASGRPRENADLSRFLVAHTNGDITAAQRMRREVVQEAVKQLFTPEERHFFEPLLSPKFALTASASRYRDGAEEVARRLRQSAITAEGPFYLALSWKAEERLNTLWKDPDRSWRGAWLEEACRLGRFLPGVQDASANKFQAAVLLPNGWAPSCAVFLTGGGLDWNRLSINDVVENCHRPSSGGPSVSLTKPSGFSRAKQYAGRQRSALAAVLRGRGPSGQGHGITGAGSPGAAEFRGTGVLGRESRPRPRQTGAGRH